jgi:hypothetical protein
VRIDRRSALAAAAGSAVLLAPQAASGQRRNDRDTLERLLSLERGLESLYDAAARRGALPSGLARRLRDHERLHAEGLEEALSGGARAPVATVPSPALSLALERGGRAFLRFALAQETAAVAAYADAVTRLADRDLLQPLGSIMAAEGQHLVALRSELGVEPLTEPFEPSR